MLHDLVARFTQGNAWVSWGAALAITAVGALVLTALKAILHRRLSQRAPLTKNRLDDLLAESIGQTSAVFLVAIPTLVALSAVELPVRAERIARGGALLACLLQAGLWASRALRVLVERRFAPAGAEPADPARQTVAAMVTLAARVVLWSVLLLVALDNLGIDVTALVAGLGVGGVAVALATQNILGDVFASVSILLDKPFVPGDFVVVGDFMGTVEHIGIKTTRVRSLGGEEIVFSNDDLLKSRVRNYKRMNERRVLFRLGLVYQTPADRLDGIPGLLREIVEGQENTRFDRAHFASYGDFALIFEVVYYVLSPDYNRYMDIQHAINLAIRTRFDDLGVEFAYPTQTLFLGGAGQAAPK